VGSDTRDLGGSLLSRIDPAGPLEAVLLLKRSGVHVASWMKRSAPLDVATVMAATAQASIQTLVEALGGSGPADIIVESAGFRILFMAARPNMVLVLVGLRAIPESVLRVEARRLLRSLDVSEAARAEAGPASPAGARVREGA